MSRTLVHAFRKVIRTGRLQITDSHGVTHLFGDGRGPLSAVRIIGRGTEWKVILDPWLAVGEAYMDGRLHVEKDLPLS